MVNSILRGAIALEPGKITRPVTRVRDFEIGTNCSETYVRFSRNHSISLQCLQFIHTAGSLYTDVPFPTGVCTQVTDSYMKSKNM